MFDSLKIKILLIFSIIVCVFIVVAVIMNKNDSAELDHQMLEVKIIIKDHKFIPDIIEVPSNTKIRLIVNNQDNSVEEFESYDLHRERIIMPNSSINIKLAPLAPGKYDFFGEFHPETAQGSLIAH